MSTTATQGKKSTKDLAHRAKSTASSKTERADKKTDAAVIKAITDRKDLKYHYPEDATTKETRKAFRTKARAALKRHTKDLKAAKKAGEQSKIDAEMKAFEKFAKATYADPESVLPRAN